MESKKYDDNPFKLKKFRRGKQATVPEYADTGLVSSPSSSPQPQVRFLEPEPGKAGAADPESGHAVTSEEEGTEEPQMSVVVSIGLLVVITVVSLLVICALISKVIVDDLRSLSLLLQSFW